MDKSISQKVLDKIRVEKISPRAEWRFIVCRVTVAVLLGFFLIVGAMSLGIIFDLFSQFEIGSLLGHPKGLKIIFFSLPYFWIIFVALFSFLAIVEFIKTRHGYKYRARYVVLFFLLLMFFLGGLFHMAGFCHKLENYFESDFPAYDRIVKVPQEVWFQPENGLLSGTIIRDDEAGCHCLELRDWDREVWRVEYSGALIRPRVIKDSGEMIKILGNKRAENRFEAEEIRPWKGRKMQSLENKIEE